MLFHNVLRFRRQRRNEHLPSEKIVVLGGGGPYTPAIMQSITQSAETLAGSEICLQDIDPSYLNMMTRLGERMADTTETEMKFTNTTDTDRALDGATFVITNFRIGGIEALKADEQIPRKYGEYGQETTGPGGTFMAQCTIPVVLDYCYSMEDLCPDAWLINYANPTNFVADAVRRKTKIKCLGLCEGYVYGQHMVSSIIEVPANDVHVYTSGINHHTWIVDVTAGGEEAYPLLHRCGSGMLEKEKSQVSKDRNLEFGLQLLQLCGYWPTLPMYWLPYYSYEEALARDPHPLYDLFEKVRDKFFKELESMARGDSPIRLDPRNCYVGSHGDFAAKVIAAISTDAGEEYVVNVPNRGAVTNLPEGSIVEVNSIVDKRGARPLCLGPMPKFTLAVMQALVVWQELAVDAALTGDKNLLLQALIADPMISSMKSAEKICDELLEAHRALLPQYFIKK